MRRAVGREEPAETMKEGILSVSLSLARFRTGVAYRRFSHPIRNPQLKLSNWRPVAQVGSGQVRLGTQQSSIDV